AAPVSDKGTSPKPVALRNSSADFDQDGWTIRHALDGNRSTAWGIYPQVGNPHHAVFELALPLGDGSEQELTFVLEQQRGGGHLIGRFRLSLTTAGVAIRGAALAGPIAAILSTPEERRPAAQGDELAVYYLRHRTEAGLATLP